MREKEQHRSSMMSLPRQLEEILWKSYMASEYFFELHLFSGNKLFCEGAQ
jgi:hypothetical protein